MDLREVFLTIVAYVYVVLVFCDCNWYYIYSWFFDIHGVK